MSSVYISSEFLKLYTWVKNRCIKSRVSAVIDFIIYTFRKVFYVYKILNGIEILLDIFDLIL